MYLFNPEVLPDRDPFEDDPDDDVNVEWAKAIALCIGVTLAFGFVVCAAVILWFASMVIQWP